MRLKNKIPSITNFATFIALTDFEIKYLTLEIQSKKQIMMKKHQKQEINTLLPLIIISLGLIHLMQR